ncbi:uncharacterized protein KGF55_001512 [Candida pseudojiufengensis]|uniref:uncharacterized protein n=1 Tax=Candida pseudojiufengensis TaxID=497109 RepID=UPI0022240035|nr:uncharacterized protein KGF55_001512 [Candida pseudojiufengensis]KAI5965292.1 hypothetical protein KGF55_001512 [Candida pseudojiufengensis]
MPLQYSAARTSNVTKRNNSKSPIKKFQRDAKKLLPSQKLYNQNLNKSITNKSGSPSPPVSPSKNNDREKLVIKDYDIQLDYQVDSSNDDLVVAIDTILDNRWSDETFLHDKFSLNHLKKLNLEERIFSIKGLSSTTKADIIKYRTQLLPEGLITTTQLYSIFNKQGHTFVDKLLELNIRKGIIRKFIISNASPIISRSLNNFQIGKVTYGFENVDLVVKNDIYYKQIEKTLSSLIDRETIDSETKTKHNTLQKFYNFIKKNPTDLFISSSNFNNEEISSLVQMGYITLNSNHFNEIENNYAISFPNCGIYLKLINEGRIWLVKLLNKIKYKEMLEDEIFNKWCGRIFGGYGQSNTKNNSDTNLDILKLNNFKKPFFGYDLNWILADALGAGIIEVFNTPVGRGWRLTGKA